VVFGVRKPLASWNPFWANLQVYSYLWFDAMRTRRWRDKIGIWFRRTGWRPADVAEKYPKAATDLAAFRKYNPVLTAGERNYLLGQFIVAVLLVLWIGDLFAQRGLPAVVVPCILLWAQLYSLGLFSEKRTTALPVEVARLLLVTPLGMLMLVYWSATVAASWIVWAGLAAYIAGSLVALRWIRRQ
jgi:hypothetical protein